MVRGPQRSMCIVLTSDLCSGHGVLSMAQRGGLNQWFAAGHGSALGVSVSNIDIRT